MIASLIVLPVIISVVFLFMEKIFIKINSKIQWKK